MRQECTLRSLWILLLLVLLLPKLSFSADGDTVVVFKVEHSAPLMLEDSTLTLVMLSWIATGDDSTIGTASFYDLRYRNDGPIIDDSTFYLGTVLPTPSPDTAGTLEEYLIQLPAGVYYFAVKVVDDADNWSLLSNIIFSVLGVFPPELVRFEQSPSTVSLLTKNF